MTLDKTSRELIISMYEPSERNGNKARKMLAKRGHPFAYSTVRKVWHEARLKMGKQGGNARTGSNRRNGDMTTRLNREKLLAIFRIYGETNRDTEKTVEQLGELGYRTTSRLVTEYITIDRGYTIYDGSPTRAARSMPYCSDRIRKLWELAGREIKRLECRL